MSTAPRTRLVRHELRFRQLVAQDVERLTPNMVRVRFSGDALNGFASDDAADHVKVFFPPPGATAVTMPVTGPRGPEWPDGVERPAARDYTPRRFDPETGTLTIDFFVHGSGPGSDWAARAKPGDVLGIGGPRGSQILEDTFDWYLLIGDETAIPTISRRIEDLPEGSRSLAVILVEDERDQQDLPDTADRTTHWVVGGSDPAGTMMETLRGLSFPDGTAFAWVSGEATMLRDIRRYLIAERGFDRSRLDVNGHWKRGTVAFDHHEAIEE